MTGLLSQGRGKGNEWVTAFLVSYSLDAYHWLYITDQYGNQRVTRFVILRFSRLVVKSSESVSKSKSRESIMSMSHHSMRHSDL